MKSEKKDISTILMDEHAVERALRKGVAHALWRHKRLGQSITVWQDGKVTRLSAEEIPDLPLHGGPHENKPESEKETSTDDADGRR